MIKKLGNLLNRPSPVMFVMYGCLLFFMIKLTFISAGFFSMLSPRLGDDALVYLWRSLSNPVNDLNNTPALLSLSEFVDRLQFEKIATEDRFEVFRVLLRTTRHSDNILHYMLAPLIQSDLSYYALFWISEFIILCVMTLGLFTLFKEQTQVKGLVLLLPLLALAILPAQGIHFLIPSTLALSFGFLVWGLIISGKPHIILLFFAALLSMFSHRVGIVHCFAGGLLVVSMFLIGQRRFDRTVKDASAILLALCVYRMTIYVLNTQNAGIENLVSYGFQNIIPNIFGASNYIANMAKIDFISILIVVLGAITMVRNLDYIGKPALLVSLLVLVGLITGFHLLEDYPGEAMVRVLVPIFILFFLMVHSQEDGEATQEETRRRDITSGSLYIACFVGLLAININFVVGNVEKRWPNMDRNKIAEEHKKLPANSHLLYYDEDFSLVGSLAANATQHKASSISLLEASPEVAKSWLQEFPVSHLVMNFPRDFKPSRRWDKSLLENTPYGFDLRNGGAFQLKFAQSAPRLFFKLADSKAGIEMKIGAQECVLHSSGSEQWFEVDQACVAGLASSDLPVTITGDTIITGLQIEEPVENVSWPWGASIEYRLESGSFFGREYKPVVGSFTLEESKSKFQKLSRTSAGNLNVISDTSGLIIAAVK